jgi:hypothetical protein
MKLFTDDSEPSELLECKNVVKFLAARNNNFTMKRVF